MTNGSKTFSKPCLGILCLSAILTTSATLAGDEDMSPNAYHIFDPETGYMITVESVPDGQSASIDANSNQPVQPLGDRSETAQTPQLWLYLVAAMLVAVGFAAWKRNKIGSGDSRQ